MNFQLIFLLLKCKYLIRQLHSMYIGFSLCIEFNSFGLQILMTSSCIITADNDKEEVIPLLEIITSGRMS